MKADRVVRREKGEMLFYVHFMDRATKGITVFAPSTIVTAVTNSLVDKLINDGKVPPKGNIFHIVCFEGGTSVFEHDFFVSELVKNGETWEDPVSAGPEASAFMGETRGHFSEEEEIAIFLARYSHRCSICPFCGYKCPKRAAPFSRLAFDAAVAKVEEANTEDNLFKPLFELLRPMMLLNC